MFESAIITGSIILIFLILVFFGVILLGGISILKKEGINKSNWKSKFKENKN